MDDLVVWSMKKWRVGRSMLGTLVAPSLLLGRNGMVTTCKMFLFVLEAPTEHSRVPILGLRILDDRFLD